MPAAAPLQSALTVQLSETDTERLRAPFGEASACLPAIKEGISELVLPKIQAALGWKRIRARKGRVNDWKTVALKYNSLWHRDRHIYGGAAAATCAMNLSAVVYLDRSRFDFLEGSHLPGQPTQLKELDMPAGTIAVFPSCLIHRAVALAESKQRRVIVLFDIEDPDEPSPMRHDIVTCPGWTQKPLLDGIFGADNVEGNMLTDLLANRPYFWRYFRRDANRRVHWQVTTAADDGVAADAAPTIAYNTSFYLIGASPTDYPSHVTVYDHRGTIRYIFNLLRFHLGFEVIS